MYIYLFPPINSQIQEITHIYVHYVKPLASYAELLVSYLRYKD
jgi:hypothetical protein